jgi:hypothetical protein
VHKDVIAALRYIIAAHARFPFNMFDVSSPVHSQLTIVVSQDKSGERESQKHT